MLLLTDVMLRRTMNTVKKLTLVFSLYLTLQEHWPNSCARCARATVICVWSLVVEDVRRERERESAHVRVHLGQSFTFFNGTHLPTTLSSLLLFVRTKTKSPNFLELSLVQAAPRLWGINKDLGHFASSFWRKKKSLKTAKVLSIIIHFASDSQKGFFSDRSNISWHLERAFFNGTKKKWNPFGIDCCCQSWWVSFCHTCCIRWDCTRQRRFKNILYWIREGMCKQRGGGKNRPAKKSAQKSWRSLRWEREEKTPTSSEMNRVSPLLSLFSLSELLKQTLTALMMRSYSSFLSTNLQNPGRYKVNKLPLLLLLSCSHPVRTHSISDARAKERESERDSRDSAASSLLD